jgi:hypothetical protein
VVDKLGDHMTSDGCGSDARGPVEAFAPADEAALRSGHERDVEWKV